MKIWNKIKFPLLIGLIVLLLAFIRYLSLAAPSWAFDVLISLLYPLVVVRFLSQAYFESEILLEILLISLGVGAVICIPRPERFGKLRRYLLRPALASVIILVLSNAAISANDGWEDALYQRQLDASYQQIREFVDEADEAIAYNTSTHRFDDNFLDAFPELALDTVHLVDNQHKTVHYVTDVILIDYDTQRLGIVYFRYGDPEFYEYQLKPADQLPKNLLSQLSVDLPQSGASLYCYRVSAELKQYTSGFGLTMADGSIYTITGLSDEDYLFLGLNYPSIEIIDNFPSVS